MHYALHYAVYTMAIHKPKLQSLRISDNTITMENAEIVLEGAKHTMHMLTTYFFN